MVTEYSNSKTYIDNKETAIQNIFYDNFLIKYDIKKDLALYNDLDIIFIDESPTRSDKIMGKKAGRIDIKASLLGCGFNKYEDYFIIECKRIDGSHDLNKSYITEGIHRFIVENKYKSFCNKNIMFGFVVSGISIKENTQKINEIHQNDEKLKNKIKTHFREYELKDNDYALYFTEYDMQGNEELELKHFFFNFSAIIKLIIQGV